MTKLQTSLDFLLEKYSVDTKAALTDDGKVLIENEKLPLFPHRFERTFIELKNIVTGGTLTGVSVMRVARILTRGSDLYTALYREFDICQFVLDRRIKSVTVMENENTLNAIATTEDGVVCTIEISATLIDGEKPKEKHEIISQRGIACDVVVDAQLKQDSIYVFGTENKTFTDVDFELYSLTANEIAVVRSAFALAQSKNFCEVKAADENLCTLVECARKSAKQGERVVL